MKNENLRVIQLTAENVKRIVAIDITPDGHVQVVTGRNAQGKTSVLDAIWLALGGGAASRSIPSPVREGQDEAFARVDLGDIIVERKWAGGKSTLSVTAPGGAKFPSPQSMLDELVGRLSFDPLAFTRLAPKDQVTALLEVVDLGLDLDDLDNKRRGFYDKRTEAGRALANAEGALATLGPVEDAGDDTTSITDLMAELTSAEVVARSRQELAKSREDISAAVDRLRRDLAAAEVELHRVMALEIPDGPDPEEIRARIVTAEARGDVTRRNNERANASDTVGRCRADVAIITQQIDAIDAKKAAALAGAKFPIEGLALTDAGVTYNGVPFEQASSSEQIRVSLAIAMALNPKLRVLRILDGSLLDDDAMAAIADMAKTQNYQVWIERVADPVGIVIEDGQVVE